MADLEDAFWKGGGRGGGIIRGRGLSGWWGLGVVFVVVVVVVVVLVGRGGQLLERFFMLEALRVAPGDGHGVAAVGREGGVWAALVRFG